MKWTERVTATRYAAGSITGKTLYAALVAGITCAGPALADTFTVTNLDDSGSGSLRAAIANANALAGSDRIEFSPGLAGTISLASALPNIADELAIVGPGVDIITVSGNQTVRIFFIAPDVTVLISGLTAANGYSGFDTNGIGGAIWNQGSLVIEDSAVRNSVARTSGGGLANDGELTIARSSVSGNSAPPEDFGIGGALENLGTATILDSTFSANSADIGGAIANDQGDLFIINSTMSGNTSAFIGGALDNFEGSVDLLHVTVFGNESPDGAGLNNEGDTRIKNALLAGNIGGDCLNDAGVSFATSGNNFDSDGSCPGFTTATTSELAVAALADNGGPTPTRALGPASVAVDASPDCTAFDSSTTVNADQRGFPRPVGSACDSGAFELETTAPPDEIFRDRFESS